MMERQIEKPIPTPAGVGVTKDSTIRSRSSAAAPSAESPTATSKPSAGLNSVLTTVRERCHRCWCCVGGEVSHRG
jgi:hypothetical protein